MTMMTSPPARPSRSQGAADARRRLDFERLLLSHEFGTSNYAKR